MLEKWGAFRGNLKEVAGGPKGVFKRFVTPLYWHGKVGVGDYKKCRIEWKKKMTTHLFSILIWGTYFVSRCTPWLQYIYHIFLVSSVRWSVTDWIGAPIPWPSAYGEGHGKNSCNTINTSPRQFKLKNFIWIILHFFQQSLVPLFCHHSGH